MILLYLKQNRLTVFSFSYTTSFTLTFFSLTNYFYNIYFCFYIFNKPHLFNLFYPTKLNLKRKYVQNHQFFWIFSCWSYGTEEEPKRNGGRSIWNFFCFLFLISSIYAPKSLFLWKLIILKFEISSKYNFEIKKRECLLLCKYEHFGWRLLYLRTNICLSCPIR